MAVGFLRIASVEPVNVGDMEKEKTYHEVRFSADVIQEAVEAATVGANNVGLRMHLRVGDATWTFDDIEEFLAEYRDPNSTGRIDVMTDYRTRHPLSVTYFDAANRGSVVTVNGKTRSEIERRFSIFEKNVPLSRLPPREQPREQPKPLAIFIGHGRNTQWRDLKDHLQDKHGYSIEAYEVGARAGHIIRDILQEMLKKSSFAILVMTGEDGMADGHLRPRENVVHEVGLFQGRLGFNRVVVLVEEGVEPFSNLQGIHQIRYDKGVISMTYGEVLATLRREFG